MSRVVVLAALLALAAGCSLTPAQKKWTTVAVGVLVVGAVIAHQDDGGSAGKALDDPTLPCRPQPDGSCR